MKMLKWYQINLIKICIILRLFQFPYILIKYLLLISWLWLLEIIVIEGALYVDILICSIYFGKFTQKISQYYLPSTQTFFWIANNSNLLFYKIQIIIMYMYTVSSNIQYSRWFLFAIRMYSFEYMRYFLNIVHTFILTMWQEIPVHIV